MHLKLRQPLDFSMQCEGPRGRILGFLQSDWWKSMASSTFGHSVKRPSNSTFPKQVYIQTPAQFDPHRSEKNVESLSDRYPPHI